MDTPEIVRRLTEHRDVTPARARKLLHLLNTPQQLTDVLEALEEPDRTVVFETLTEQVVARHFAQRRR